MYGLRLRYFRLQPRRILKAKPSVTETMSFIPFDLLWTTFVDLILVVSHPRPGEGGGFVGCVCDVSSFCFGLFVFDSLGLVVLESLGKKPLNACVLLPRVRNSDGLEKTSWYCDYG